MEGMEGIPMNVVIIFMTLAYGCIAFFCGDERRRRIEEARREEEARNHAFCLSHSQLTARVEGWRQGWLARSLYESERK